MDDQKVIPLSRKEEVRHFRGWEQWWMNNGWKLVAWPLGSAWLLGFIVVCAKLIVGLWDGLLAMF